MTSKGKVASYVEYMKYFSEQQYLKTGFYFILSAAEIPVYKCCSSILFLTSILFYFVFGHVS